MNFDETRQEETDRNWESLKQSFLDKGFSDVEFLKIQIGFAYSNGLPTDIKELRKKAYKAFEDEV